MSVMKRVIVIIITFCFLSQVRSDSAIWSKKYKLGNEKLIIGQNHVDKRTLVYALCENDPYDHTALCKVKLDRDPFDESILELNCPIHISTALLNGKIKVLRIDFWDEDKVILTWQDLDNTNWKSAWVTMIIIYMSDCRSREYKVLTDNRPDMKPQIFITPKENSFLVSFRDHRICDNHMCSMTINADGTVSPIIPWFAYSDLIYSLVPFEDDPRSLLITIGDIGVDYGVVKYYMLNGNQKVELTHSYYVDDIGYSTSNGIISFCSVYHCGHFNHQTVLFNTITLRMQHKPCMYKALYNLPFGGHLALICDLEIDSHYRIIWITNDGHEAFSKDLKKLRCSRRPDYMTSKFFQKNDVEYCLSVFYSIYISEGWIIFKTYCFNFQEFL